MDAFINKMLADVDACVAANFNDIDVVYDEFLADPSKFDEVGRMNTKDINMMHCKHIEIIDDIDDINENASMSIHKMHMDYQTNKPFRTRMTNESKKIKIINAIRKKLKPESIKMIEASMMAYNKLEKK